MTAYVLSQYGAEVVSPDCLTTNTGEPAGINNGVSYWQWDVDGTTFYLFNGETPSKIHWYISQEIPGGTPTVGWSGENGPTPEGTFNPGSGCWGSITVSELVEESSGSSQSSVSTISTASSQSQSTASSLSTQSTASSLSSVSSSTAGLGLFPIEVSITFSGQMTVAVGRRSS